MHDNKITGGKINDNGTYNLEIPCDIELTADIVPVAGIIFDLEAYDVNIETKNNQLKITYTRKESNIIDTNSLISS